MKLKEKHKKCMLLNFPAYIKQTFVFLSFLLMSLAISAQNITVKGIVKDAIGEPLIGVSVKESNNVVGTVTDIDGKYEIKVNSAASLTFSYIGYKPQTVKVNGRATLDVTIREDASLLNEVVVIGYGTAKKRDITGSIESISAKAIEERSPINVFDAMQGQLAGVEITTGSGAPGEAASVRVRGISTFGEGASPLYIVDGVPMDDISMLNAGDVASRSIERCSFCSYLWSSCREWCVFSNNKTRRQNRSED